MSVIDQVRKAVAPLARRVMLMVARAVVRMADDARGLQELQASLLAGEVRDRVERVQEYGYTSVPLPGAEAVLVFVSGNRDHGLAVATDDRRHRPAGLQPGEVCIYTDEGDRIHLQRGRVVEITTQTLRVNAGARVEITTPVLEINAGQAMTVQTQTFGVTAGQQAGIQAPAVNLGGGSAAATMAGSLHVTGKVTSDDDQVAAGISQVHHVHGGVVVGADQTGEPE